MTTYNTGNPIGSKDPRDLYDNAENLDEAVNTRAAESWDDRFGVARKTWWGMEQDFQQFLIDSGYQNIGDYAAGLEITARNQIFWRDGELYRAGASLELPYTTTGDWGSEEGLFVAVGDAALRPLVDDLFDLNAEVQEKLSYYINVIDYGAEPSGDEADAANNTAAFYAAMADASARGVPVLIPGDYVINNIAIDVNVTFVGSRQGNSVRLPVSSTEELFSLSADDLTVSFRGVNFVDTLTANIESPTRGRAMFVGNRPGSNVRFDDCTFTGMSTFAIAFYGHSVTGKDEVLNVSGCRFLNGAEFSNTVDNCKTILLLNGPTAWIDSNEFIQPTPMQSYGRTAITIGTGSTMGQIFNKAHITNNYIYGCGKLANDVGGALGAIDCHEYLEDSVISGNRIVNYIHSAIRMKADTRRTIITKNIVLSSQAMDGNASAGISLTPSTRGEAFYGIHITDNIVADSQGRGIGVTSTETDPPLQQVTISGNTIRSSGTFGIFVSGVNSCIVDGNVISISGSAAINTYNCGGLYVISNNAISSAEGAGIILRQTIQTRFTISGNSANGLERAFIQMQSDITAVSATGNTADNITMSGGVEAFMEAAGVNVITACVASNICNFGVTTTSTGEFQNLQEGLNSWNA